MKRFTILLLAVMCMQGIAWADITTGLVLHYTFDDGAGSTATDSSGSGLNGTLQTGVTWASPGRVGASSASFNGSGGYITLSDSSVLSPGTGDWTIAVFVYTDTLDGNDHWVYSNSGSGTIANLLRINVDNHLNHFIRDASSNYVDTQTTTVLTINTWYCVVGTKVGTTSQLYLNGVQESTASNGSLGAVDTSGGTAPIIGALTDGSARYWSGKMDEMRLFSRALSQSDINEFCALYIPAAASGRK